MDQATCAAFCLAALFAQAGLVVAETSEEYREMAREEIEFATKEPEKIYKRAKNVVLMIGDGMGLPTVTAARIYKGQTLGHTGEEYKLNFEKFPWLGLSKTYNSDRQVADSAAAASAILTGVKVNYGTTGLDPSVPYAKSCAQFSEAKKLKSFLKLAAEDGKSVGIVTTTRITHATPAAAYAHTTWRDWESDTTMAGIQGCEQMGDIARQLVDDNSYIQVLLGGGRRNFYNSTTPDPTTGTINSKYQREDGRDLTRDWREKKEEEGAAYAYVETRGELMSVDADSTDYLFGLFSSSHMDYQTERDTSENGQPSLSEMTDKALEILKKNPKGFFLLVEGGRIDHAHHDNEAKRSLIETVEFDDTVELVNSKTSISETLTVVTADHSHVFSIAGYPSRGRDILGLVDIIGEGEAPNDGLPYTTLTYSNGPEAGRTDLTSVNTKTDTYRFAGCVQMPYETHGGEDVPIYAKGPHAHLFHKTHEQHYIAWVMMYATCTGEFKDNDCRADFDPSTASIPHAACSHIFSLIMFIIFTFLY